MKKQTVVSQSHKAKKHQETSINNWGQSDMPSLNEFT